jgi:hypothetical protein
MPRCKPEQWQLKSFMSVSPVFGGQRAAGMEELCAVSDGGSSALR